MIKFIINYIDYIVIGIGAITVLYTLFHTFTNGRTFSLPEAKNDGNIDNIVNYGRHLLNKKSTQKSA